MWLDRWRGVFDPCFVMFIPLVPLEEGWLPLMWDMMSKKLPMTRHYDGIKLKLPLTKHNMNKLKRQALHECLKLQGNTSTLAHKALWAVIAPSDSCFRKKPSAREPSWK